MRRVPVAVVLCATLAAGRARAQDMEPKAYSASPVGANFLVGSYSHSSGGVVFDPTLPISDVDARVQGFVAAVGHSFNLFGDLALATVAVPYALADVSGKVGEQAAAISRSGLADTQFRFSVNLRGNPAMSVREFVRAPRRTIVGASLTVSAPAGQYYDSKLINIGNNRWAFKPEVGISIPIRKLDADAYFATWLFTSNDDFYPGGRKRSQDPLFSVQAHLSYSFKPRLWLAADSTWYSGGSTRIDDGDQSPTVNNSRLGVTLSLPVGNRYSCKVAYASGVIVRTGTNFTTFAVAWQVLWFTQR
ncbi:MAG TPA: transporter [Vicinamibacterales bacterium]|nr:transporter [Vicinamibacterales bacterium]